jgi:hypothetical protein
MKGTVTIPVEDFCDLLKDKLLLDRIIDAAVLTEAEHFTWAFIGVDVDDIFQREDPARYAELIQKLRSAKSLPVDLPDEEASHEG